MSTLAIVIPLHSNILGFKWTHHDTRGELLSDGILWAERGGLCRVFLQLEFRAPGLDQIRTSDSGWHGEFVELGAEHIFDVTVFRFLCVSVCMCVCARVSVCACVPVRGSYSMGFTIAATDHSSMLVESSSSTSRWSFNLVSIPRS